MFINDQIHFSGTAFAFRNIAILDKSTDTVFVSEAVEGHAEHICNLVRNSMDQYVQYCEGQNKDAFIRCSSKEFEVLSSKFADNLENSKFKVYVSKRIFQNERNDKADDLKRLCIYPGYSRYILP